MNNIFKDEQLKPAIRTGLTKIDFTEPTKVQEKVIPILLAHKNAVVQAVTGSGKTHSFLIPVLNDIASETPYTQAILTAPSRELAEQLYQVARQLRDAANLQISIANLVGGSDRERQLKKLNNQKPQVVIATPGRLHDFVEKKILYLDYVKDLIIDEADMTLDMGFLSDIDFIIQRLPKNTTLAAFSATIPVKLSNFLRKYMAKPEQIVIDNPLVISPTVKNDLIDIGSKSRKRLLYQLLTMGQPYLALIFANTKQNVDELTQYLQEEGLKVAKIHGGITERERKRTLREVENGQYQYVVATDLAARGLDIDGVSLVVNYEIPRNLEFVVHRIGRTGRNKMTGHAVTLIREEEMTRITSLEQMGIHFDFVEIKNGELVSRKHYHRRDTVKFSSHTLDPNMKGFVKKTKKKRKPGYKKKIKRAIQQDKAQKNKIEQRHKMRKEKAQRKKRRDRK
ncbi:MULTISPECIES: DEAD/DEAH box helicase [unclassified Lactobacillus]|uniref:DEAD/DEAH box helicase n=1 Tax=unclassified Lactobacillus TaxID=2620435 RepID=UPI000EFA6028|nr:MULTISPECIES: DEAD/DEAH box helicase [unclassified Lactobacillus]RMC23924.1 DEAD/DEAH box helicase [Lactobacillus sp. ESL0247]RMC28295.1 DEAD/DEAH box helicase [Lactobacillus sp. ESL0246]RMC31021.1 DEAD/DEAH box helicase [Lactobacillus sp. ESL0245]